MNPYGPPGVSAPYPAAHPLPYGGPTPGAVSEVAVDLLRQTRPWVMFISVMCFIGSGFMLLVAALFAFAGTAASMMAGGSKMFPPALLGIVYVPLAAIYVYPGVKLWMYGSAIEKLLASRSTMDLESALLQQKSFWKFSGISMIVVFILYVVVFVVLIAIGVATGLGKT